MAGTDAEKSFTIRNIYIKDLSFEAPKSPAVFSKDVSWKPRLKINIGWVTNKLSDTLFESVLKVTVTADLEKKTVYLVEVQQAGIFELKGCSKEEIEPLLNTYCPQILFPFVREAIADMVGKGGFPQLMLKPMDFDAIYAQNKAQAEIEEPQPDEESVQ